MKTLLLTSHPKSDQQALCDNRDRAFTRCLMKTYLKLTPIQRACVSEQRSINDILRLEEKTTEESIKLRSIWSCYRNPGIEYLKGRIAYLNTHRYLYQFHARKMQKNDEYSEHVRMSQIIESNFYSYNLLVHDRLSNDEIFKENLFPLTTTSATQLLSKYSTPIDELTLEEIMKDDKTSPSKKMRFICLQIARLVLQFDHQTPLPATDITTNQKTHKIGLRSTKSMHSLLDLKAVQKHQDIKNTQEKTDDKKNCIIC